MNGGNNLSAKAVEILMAAQESRDGLITVQLHPVSPPNSGRLVSILTGRIFVAGTVEGQDMGERELRAALQELVDAGYIREHTEAPVQSVEQYIITPEGRACQIG